MLNEFVEKKSRFAMAQMRSGRNGSCVTPQGQQR